MAKQIQAIRGMNDCLPSETPAWQKVEASIRQVVAAYGYNEIRMPVVESTDLFKRSVGEVTDIVEKEMYTFEDRNGDSLSLRPEGTACCVRAGNQHGLLYNQEQRLWYMGPMFRHERPQKGRYRQFHQLGVEAFGMRGPDIDAEVIMLSARFWKAFGLEKHVRLQLNTLGSNEERAAYCAALTEYLIEQQAHLDDDAKRRMHTNPLRVLDSKNAQVQAALKNAPSLSDFFGEETTTHFSGLKDLLDAAGITYEVNPRLVRGLDYYNYTVFEWVTESLGSQGTVCAGGRYDGLVEQLGGKPSPAVGFAMGMERLILLVQTLDLVGELASSADIYLISAGQGTQSAGFALGEQIRSALPTVRVMNHCGGGNFKKQFKRADKSGAKIALIIGEEELTQQRVTIKYLREDKPQQQIAQEELIAQLKTEFNV